MDKQIFVYSGMGFGDEGKGTFVDYLAKKLGIRQIVRYNGGSQASHTVITPLGNFHKFSQLGSGMFLAGCKTFLTRNMVINPFDLIEEIKRFSNKTGLERDNILSRIFIDKDCYIVTPYHSLINRLRELSMGCERRGSVGSGVSEVRRLLKEKSNFGDGQGIQMEDLYYENILYAKLEELFNFTRKFIADNQDAISKNTPDAIRESLENEIRFLTNVSRRNQIWNDYLNLVQEHKFNVIVDLSSSIQEEDGVIFEGAQGLLIDEVYGLRPNTTILDTTNKYALQMVEKMENRGTQVVKIGIAKAFSSRHGLGVFPTEAEELNRSICDNNQEESYWQGSIRFGWFDAVLTRYAQTVNIVDEIFLSSVDKLSSFSSLKVCDSYLYKGSVDDEFRAMFEFEQKGETVIIRNILNNQGNISKYLMQCEPIYIVVDGWNEDISNVRSKDEFPENCIKYIDLIEQLTNIRITVVSVGPTREEKVVM